MVRANWSRHRLKILFLGLALGTSVLFWNVRRVPRVVGILRFAFDLLPDIAAIFLAVLLAAAGLALLFLPEELKRLEGQRRVRVISAITLLTIGVIFGAGGVISDLVQKREDREAANLEKQEAKNERDRLTGQVSTLLEQQKLATTKEDLLQGQVNRLAGESIPELLSGVRHIAKPNQGPIPDVTLRFVYSKSPAVLIVNQSDAIAREIKWTVVLWNMDLPDRDDPLPIPVSVFDWLRPHAEGGPNDLFGNPSVASLLSKGNHLFGTASVICPECIRGRTFAVYIVLGVGGWFSEFESDKSGNVVIPKSFRRETRESFFKELEAAVPGNSRAPIRER